MNFNFRQGLTAPRTEAGYLLGGGINGSTIQLISTVSVVFAHGPVNYSHTISNSTWNVSLGDWLYWDVDTLTGKLSVGTTVAEPMYGPTLPSEPDVDDHFFDTSDNYMKVWDGITWIRRIRVFAGSIDIEGSIKLSANGSHVGLVGIYEANPIRFYKVGAPIRLELNDGNFTFATDSGDNTQDVGQYDNFDLSELTTSVTVAEPMTKNTAVAFNATGEVIAASYASGNPVLGILNTNASVVPAVLSLTTSGNIEDRTAFNFTEPPMTPLYIDTMGQLTTVIPRTGSIQKIGHVVSPSIIFINIKPKIHIIP